MLRAVVTLDPSHMIADLPELRLSDRPEIDQRCANFFGVDLHPSGVDVTHFDDQIGPTTRRFRRYLEPALEGRGVFPVGFGNIGAKDTIAAGEFPAADTHADGIN